MMQVQECTRESVASIVERPSVEEWVLASLRARGSQTLDQLGSALPETNWAQLFLAIDRLSRSGLVTLRPARQGDYLVSLTPTHLTAA